MAELFYDKRMRKVLSALAVLLLLAGGCNNSPYAIPLQVGSKTIQVQVAADSVTQERGLSSRDALTDDQGMLFDFGVTKGDYPAFWMKDMTFPLDLIWIQDKKIIGITPDVQPANLPDEQMPRYFPPSPISWVLEVNAGWVQRHHIKVGDEVKFR